SGLASWVHLDRRRGGGRYVYRGKRLTTSGSALRWHQRVRSRRAADAEHRGDAGGLSWAGADDQRNSANMLRLHRPPHHPVPPPPGARITIFTRRGRGRAGPFPLGAPAAKPPCGDLCFVFEGTPQSLKAMLDRAGARIEEGPVPRQGGRREAASSVYTRD